MQFSAQPPQQQTLQPQQPVQQQAPPPVQAPTPNTPQVVSQQPAIQTPQQSQAPTPSSTPNTNLRVHNAESNLWNNWSATPIEQQNKPNWVQYYVNACVQSGQRHEGEDEKRAEELWDYFSNIR